MTAEHPRSTTYYWKCDRPAAFHGTAESFHRHAHQRHLSAVLSARFPGTSVALHPAAGQGNHITWRATVGGREFFARIEDGPEQDDYLEVESRVLEKVRALGIPAPQVHAVDASRQRVPFAWQLLEYVPCRDLNELHKTGRLDMAGVAAKIGAAVAQWQTVRPRGFGPFDPAVLRSAGRLEGFHRRYEDYFFLHLERHLSFLVESRFLSDRDAGEMTRQIEGARGLLALEQGCLVHKDLALWNILGTEAGIAAFIDWDDAISGDPMDDLSLLACFHDAPFLKRALQGYQAVRPLPAEYRRRFWLHLLRNMVVKSVIRVGAGYFDRDDGFFLIGIGCSGTDLRQFTRKRLAVALQGLRNDSEIAIL